MRMPLWLYRLLHRQRMSRSRLRGGWLHLRLGDRLLDKALWRPTRESLARAWLVGFPITTVPFLPGQSLLAALAAFLVRGNVLTAVALQFLSNPFTAPMHLSACYFVGELLRGRFPADVMRHAWEMPTGLISVDAVASLYLGALVIGLAGGTLGYIAIQRLASPHIFAKRHQPKRAPRDPR